MAITRQELESYYALIEKPIHNFALRWTWNPSLAEELVHEAFVRVWSRRHAVDPATLRGLLYKTVQNLALNERRKSRVREVFFALGSIFNGGQGEPVPDSEAAFLAQENLRALRHALESLPLELREALLLCEYSEMSHAEIGAALGIPPGTVGSRRNRALKKLKEAMEGPHE